MNRKILFIVSIFSVVFIISCCWWYIKGKNKQINNINTGSEKNVVEDLGNYKTEFIDDQSGELVSYVNSDIGVEFRYPKKWGEIKEWKNQGCYDYQTGGTDQSIITEQDKCFQIALYASSFKDSLFFSTQSPLRIKYGAPRGGYWGDATGLIKSESDVKNFCKGKSKNLCNVFKTKNNLLVARNIETREFSNPEDKIAAYYIKSTHPLYSSIIMSSGRLGYENADEDLKKVIDSLIFLQNK